jgi:exosortase
VPSGVQPDPNATPARLSPVAVLLGLALLVLLGLLFLPRFWELMDVWSKDDNYSHGFLVGPLAVYLGWEVFRRQGAPRKGSLPAGLCWMALGGVFHLWAMVVGWSLVDFLALTTLLYGTAVLLGGRAWAAGFAFPIALLFFLFPLPPRITDEIALWLQGVVTTASVAILQLVVPTEQAGNMIRLSGQELQVGEACSGLRQMMAFVALGLLVAYWSERSLPFKVVLVLAAVPIAVAANLLRVLLMAFLVCNLGPEWISEEQQVVPGLSYHTAWGLLTMLVGLVLFLLVRWWLGSLFPADGEARRAHGPEASSADAPRPRPLVVPLLAALLALGITLVAQTALRNHLHAAEPSAPQLTQSLSGFPVSLGAWSRGQEPPLGPATLPYFQSADDRLNCSYVPAQAAGEETLGLTFQVFAVHFRDGTDRRHHPRICNKVAGNTELESTPIRMSEGEQVGEAPAQRFCFADRPSGRYFYVYYWYYTLEPTETEGLTVLQRIHQDVGVRRPSLSVQISTTARTAEQLKKADAFARRVDHELGKHLPPGARRGSDLLHVTHLGAPRRGTR